MIAALAPWAWRLALVAALLSLAVAAAPVAWHLGGWSAALPPRPAPPAPAAAAPPPDLDGILALAPFGAPAEAAPPAAPEAPAAETGLDLELRGIVLQDDPGASTAFIASGGRTQGYRVGDRVAEVADLVEVTGDRVVLDVGGELQTLSFPNAGGDLAAEATVPEALSGPDRLRAMIAAQTAQGFDDPPPPTREVARPVTTQDYIDLWRDRIRANPAEVLDTIGLIPTGDGYRIAESHDSGVGLAGLLAGDVVTSVNGEAVGDVDRDRRLFDEVAASGLARIEVRRGEDVLTFSFPLE